MYGFGALECFDGRPLDQVKEISIEIAVLRMSRLDVNDFSLKYTLKSLADNFSGLHLFCIEYVGFLTEHHQRLRRSPKTSSANLKARPYLFFNWSTRLASFVQKKD
jgi:hypothetical protein